MKRHQYKISALICLLCIVLFLLEPISTASGAQVERARTKASGNDEAVAHQQVLRPQLAPINYILFKQNGKWGVKKDPRKIIVLPIYDEIAPFKSWNGFISARARRSGKWGCIDMEGKEIVPFVYDEIGDFAHEGIVAKVKKDGKWGYIDLAGNEIIPSKYDEIGSFFQLPWYDPPWVKSGSRTAFTKFEQVLKSYAGFHCLREGRVAVLANDRWGFIDTTGSLIVPPTYERVRCFRDGMAAVETGGLWGFINEYGKEVVASRYHEVLDFSEGMAAVGVKTGTEEMLFGFVDKTGREVIQPQYGAAGKFREGLAAVRSPGRDGKWTFIDPAGKKLFPPRYDLVWSFSEGRAAVNRGAVKRSRTPDFDDYQFWKQKQDLSRQHPREEDGKWGFIDRTGKEIGPLKYVAVSPFMGGYAGIKEKKPSGYRKNDYVYGCYTIDKKGRMDHPQASQYRYRIEGVNRMPRFLVRARLDDKWGYLDATGREVAAVKYDELPDFPAEMPSHRLSEIRFIRMKHKGKYGYLDVTGNEAIPAKYDEAPADMGEKDYGQGYRVLTRVRQNGKYGYLARETGDEVVPFRYEDGPKYMGGRERTRVKRDGKWGYIDNQGKEVSSFSVEDDPCTFRKKRGDHFIFGDHASMRSKPDPDSDVIAHLPPGTKIKVQSKADEELTLGDVTDNWYEAIFEGEKGYVWGGWIADSGYAGPVKGTEVVIAVRNRTRAEDHSCYHKKFEMQMTVGGKIVSLFKAPDNFSRQTVEVTSIKYVSFPGFSAPLNFLVLNIDTSDYPDKYVSTGTGKVLFYIDHGDLVKVLDEPGSITGSGFNASCDVKMPDTRRGKDSVTFRCSGGFIGAGKDWEEHYTWDWNTNTFVKAK